MNRVIATAFIGLLSVVTFIDRASASGMPAFGDLDELTGAIVARICMNQIFMIPEHLQANINEEGRTRIKECMISYRDIFDRKQLNIIRCLWLKIDEPGCFD